MQMKSGQTISLMKERKYAFQEVKKATRFLLPISAPIISMETGVHIFPRLLSVVVINTG